MYPRCSSAAEGGPTRGLTTSSTKRPTSTSESPTPSHIPPRKRVITPREDGRGGESVARSAGHDRASRGIEARLAVTSGSRGTSRGADQSSPIRRMRTLKNVSAEPAIDAARTRTELPHAATMNGTVIVLLKVSIEWSAKPSRLLPS